MPEKIRVVHYLNQFFAGIGAESQADVGPSSRIGPVGPGVLLAKALGDRAEVVATLVCGDNFANERAEELLRWAAEELPRHAPDVLVAGPAFNAGRYGEACGLLCDWAQNHLGIPAVTAMYRENPAAERYAPMMYIVSAERSAVGMARAIAPLAEIAVKAAQKLPIGPAREEGYLPRGVRRNTFRDRSAAERGVEMLVAKLRGEPFRTEVPVQVYEAVTPAKPVVDMRTATVAIVTESGLVPMGNPDHIEWARATKWRKYPIAGKDDLVSGDLEAVHGGFDNTWVNQDPDRMIAVDVLRQLEREGAIGKLHDWYYVTTGNGTSIENSKRFGREIAAELVAAGVQAVVSPST